jgi:tetratricopeptide (TPR) repeat protein
MTPRQSNIIFYTFLSFVATALIIDATAPEFFSDFAKTKEELLLKEALNKGDHNRALTSYQFLIEERISDGNEIDTETAIMYEDMAKSYALLGNKVEAKNHYLKSLNIKKQLAKNNLFAFSNTYYQLGVLAEEEQQTDQALMYFEKALFEILGDTTETEEERGGYMSTMLKSQIKHGRLNHESTIAIFKKLAAMHIIKKEYAIAKTYYEKALTASKVVFGEDDKKTLDIMGLMNQLNENNG